MVGKIFSDQNCLNRIFIFMEIPSSIYKQPKDKKGNYENEYHPMIPKFSDVLKWKNNTSEYLKHKKNEFKAEPGKMMPVRLIY
jgi:hypothetical protein